MKKLIAILLAVMMMATLSMSVFAETVDKSQDITVKGEYEDKTTTPDKIVTDISWGAMEFTYTKSGQMDWDDKNHKYDDNTKGAWTATGNTVTVINHSNVAVVASFKFEADTEYSGITGTFSSPTIELKSAVGVGTTEAELATLTGTTTLSLSGDLKSGTAEGTTVGTITVTIVKKTQS